MSKMTFHPSHRLRSTDDGLYTVKCILCDRPDTAPEMASACSAMGDFWQAEFSLLWHLNRQHAHSLATFGPVSRGTKGVIAHIRKELEEIEADPSDTMEWIDVILLALDGAMRAGLTPKAVITKLVEKQLINERREWPDWKTLPDDAPVEHVRDK